MILPTEVWTVLRVEGQTQKLGVAYIILRTLFIDTLKLTLMSNLVDVF